MNRSYIYFFFSALGYLSTALDVTSYPRCSDPAQENPGYSSQIYSGLKFWSHCGFPNPKTEVRRCGRRYYRGSSYSVCDPDNVLSDHTVAQLDTVTWSVEQSTPYQCTPWHGSVLNYTVLVVAVRYLRVPNLSNNNTCLNSCGEMIPDLDVTTRQPSRVEKQAAIDSFALGLLTNFDGYFCENFGVVVYWQNESMISTALAKGMKSFISEEHIALAEQLALIEIQNGNIGDGFKILLDSYQTLLIGLAPAYVLLIINLVILFLTSIAVLIYFVFAPKSDYYDEETWKLILNTTIKVLFGVWFIEVLMASLVWLQNHMKPVMIVLPLIGLLASITVAIVLVIQESSTSSSE